MSSHKFRNPTKLVAVHTKIYKYSLQLNTSACNSLSKLWSCEEDKLLHLSIYGKDRIWVILDWICKYICILLFIYCVHFQKSYFVFLSGWTLFDAFQFQHWIASLMRFLLWVPLTLSIPVFLYVIRKPF